MMETYKEHPESFGPLVRRLRKNLSLSLEATAARAGISPSYLSRLERGIRQPPPGSVIGRLAEALEVTPVVLLLAAGILSPHSVREMGAPPYGVDLTDWNDALARLSADDWQDIQALIQTKLARHRAFLPDDESPKPQT